MIEPTVNNHRIRKYLCRSRLHFFSKSDGWRKDWYYSSFILCSFCEAAYSASGNIVGEWAGSKRSWHMWETHWQLHGGSEKNHKKSLSRISARI